MKNQGSRRRFRRSWLVFSPFIRLIRVIALGQLRPELARERRAAGV